MHLYERKKGLRHRGLVLTLCVCAAVVLLFVWAAQSVSVKSEEEQMQQLKTALHRAAVLCFAVEGRYPPTLDYLKDNYGVIVNDNLYIVAYDAFASNVFPDITVMRQGVTE